jgi:hypothetical protein
VKKTFEIGDDEKEERAKKRNNGRWTIDDNIVCGLSSVV